MRYQGGCSGCRLQEEGLIFPGDKLANVCEYESPFGRGRGESRVVSHSAGSEFFDAIMDHVNFAGVDAMFEQIVSDGIAYGDDLVSRASAEPGQVGTSGKVSNMPDDSPAGKQCGNDAGEHGMVVVCMYDAGPGLNENAEQADASQAHVEESEERSVSAYRRVRQRPTADAETTCFFGEGTGIRAGKEEGIVCAQSRQEK